MRLKNENPNPTRSATVSQSPRARALQRAAGRGEKGGGPWFGAWLAIVVLSVVLAWGGRKLFELDGRIYDFAITDRAFKAPENMVIVGLTEDFIQRRHVSLMPRDRLARLIDAVAQGKPSVIAFDVWLDSHVDGPQRNGVDAQLRAAIARARRAGVAVLLAQVDAKGFVSAADDERALSGTNVHDATLPYFSQTASGTGGVDFAPDEDGVFRNLPQSSEGLPSLSLQAALRFGEKTRKPVSPQTVARLNREAAPIDFVGPPGAIRITPAEDVLKNPFLSILMQGKMVFIGATFPRSTDLFGTPYHYLLGKKGPDGKLVSRRMYGVEMLAQSADTISRGAPRHSAETFAAQRNTLGLTIAASMLVCALALRGVAWGAVALLATWGATIAAGLASARAAAAVWGFYAWPVAPLLLSSGLAFALASAYRQLRLARELRFVTDVFGAHVGDEVLKRLGGRMPELGGETWDIAVLFCDIEGFSALSETMRDDPVQLLATLNEHFEPLVRALKNRGAYVDNYVGDLVMALFGAPLPSASLGHDTANAVLAALDFVRIVDERNAARREAGERPIEVGIGLHCGPAVVGYMGMRERVHYTAVGDTVNIASRVESATRKYSTRLLVTEEVVRACGGQIQGASEGQNADFLVAGEGLTSVLRWEFVDETTVKGRVSPVRLYKPLMP